MVSAARWNKKMFLILRKYDSCVGFGFGGTDNARTMIFEPVETSLSHSRVQVHCTTT